jgi:Zn ribbon nucleic-acid-binding protein
MKIAVNPALEFEALYAKSQVYIRRGLRAQGDNDIGEYKIWASLALELLGKSALAKVHPALVADPTHYQSLFAACGRQLSPDIKTITAKTLFERLSHIDKAFDSRHQKFCEQMAIRRNAELHSGESPFSGISAEAWEREYWGAVATVLSLQDETLECWLGAEGSKVPGQIIEQAEEALHWVVEHRLMRCREDFEKQHKDLERRNEIIEKSLALTWNDRTWDGYDRGKCPACSASGFLGGTLWDEEIIDTDDGWEGIGNDGDWYTAPPIETVRKTFSVEAFECLVCGFKLFGTKEIAAGELPEDFAQEEDRTMEFEPDYGND